MLDINKFYKTFFSSDPSNVTTLDMQNTFSIHFKFKPDGITVKTTGRQNAASDVQNQANKLLQNISGGILGGSEPQDVIKLRKVANNKQSAIGSYISKGVMVGDGSNTLDLTMFVESMQLPNLQVIGVEDINTMYGLYSSSGYFVEPDSHEFNLDIRNTKLPILESVFYPWMRETTLPYWVYDDRPYTTADITVDMGDHADVKYVFYGCFPILINTYDPSMQLNGSFTRSVRFRFQYMVIKSSLKSKQSVSSRIGELGNTLKSGALKMI